MEKELKNQEHFKPWRLPMVYEVEPSLQQIAEWAATQRGRRYFARQETYEKVKTDVEKLVGWSARDPRLRCSEAWDIYMRHVAKVLKI